MYNGPKEANLKTISYKRKALVIGISKYKDKLQPLDFCKNDGEEMCEILESIGYEIEDNNRLIGFVKYEQIRDAIISFFTDPNIKADDILLFYYSGHGIPDVDGDVYLSSSEIDPDIPFKRGISFGELTKLMNRSHSTRIVTILDCCYSGAAKISKGHSDDAAKLGTSVISNKSEEIHQGEGKCLLAASLSYQEAFGLNEHGHSIFTYYLLQGLRGNEDAIDTYGNITPETLGKFVYRSIANLPPNKRPKQTPIRKVEVTGDIVLAHYKNFSKSNNPSNHINKESNWINTNRDIADNLYPKSKSNQISKKIKPIVKNKIYRRILIMILVAIILYAVILFLKTPLIEINQSSQERKILYPLNNSNDHQSNVKNNDSIIFSNTMRSNNIHRFMSFISIVPGAKYQNNSIYYYPSQIKIGKDYEVIWINNDNTIHTVTLLNNGKENYGNNSLLNSGNINPGSSYKYIFNKSGIYNYYCTLHPYMKGLVVVS